MVCRGRHYIFCVRGPIFCVFTSRNELRGRIAISSTDLLTYRLLLDSTVCSNAAELDQVVGDWDANAIINQCCTIQHVADVRTGVQGFRPTVSDTRSPRPRLHRGPRQYRRALTNATSLRLLNIPKGMHCQLGLGDMYSKNAASRRKNVCTVNLATSAIHFTVVMLRTTSSRQQHRRFSTGWREFCARAGVEIGDELVFERTGAGKELAVRVVKAGQSKARRGR